MILIGIFFLNEVNRFRVRGSGLKVQRCQHSNIKSGLKNSASLVRLPDR